MRLLLIEDDPSLGRAIAEHLADDGHSVDRVERLEDAEACAGAVPYEIILLDLMMPDGRGLDFLRALRACGNETPVVILTALDRVRDRIAGLNAGADDYLVKPFDLGELTARVAAVGRRYARHPNPLVEIGELSVDLSARTVALAGRSVALTPREWALLEELVRQRGVVFSRARLEEVLYAFGEEIGSNAVEVYVSRLRKKLGRCVIETVRGFGYRIAR